VSPDNVQEAGVSPDYQSGSPIAAAEAQQVERTREGPGHGRDPSFLCPTRLKDADVPGVREALCQLLEIFRRFALPGSSRRA
jgi:hypothetical protein